MTKEQNFMRFKIAFSFPGEYRNIIEDIANKLTISFSKDELLYDKYHEAEFAMPDLDIYLSKLYKYESELIVVGLCPEYEKKTWCRLEWKNDHKQIFNVKVHDMRIDEIEKDLVKYEIMIQNNEPFTREDDGLYDMAKRVELRLKKQNFIRQEAIEMFLYNEKMHGYLWLFDMQPIEYVKRVAECEVFHSHRIDSFEFDVLCEDNLNKYFTVNIPRILFKIKPDNNLLQCLNYKMDVLDLDNKLVRKYIAPSFFMFLAKEKVFGGYADISELPIQKDFLQYRIGPH